MVRVLNMASSTVLLLEQLPTLLSRRHPQLSHSKHFKIKLDTSIESEIQIKFINVGQFTGYLLAVKIPCFICATFFQYISTVIVTVNKWKNSKNFVLLTNIKITGFYKVKRGKDIFTSKTNKQHNNSLFISLWIFYQIFFSF